MFLSYVIAILCPLAAFALPADVNATRSKVFDLTITWEKHAPDGFARDMLLVNGISPGPTIEVEQDDWVVVNVVNKTPFNTSVHYHGISMENTPWSDGVPGVTQLPIAPGRSFTYKFQALQYGSYWYHSHVLGQIEDGLYGPIVIHPRPGTVKPFHMISNDPDAIKGMERAERAVHPLVLYDFMHITSEQKWDITPRAGIELPCYDSILFNGKGRVRCLAGDEVMSHLSPLQKSLLGLVPGQKMTDKGCIPAIAIAAFGGDVSKFNASAIPPGIFEGCKETKGSTEVVKAGHPGRNSWVALDIVGGINFVTGVLAIDDHDMWVYAMDGSYIVPQRVQALTVTNGDRYSILVKPKRPGKFPIRFHASSAPQTIIGSATLHVPGFISKPLPPKQYIDIIGNPLSPDVVFFNQTIAYPHPAEPIAKKADALHILHMKLDGSSYQWALNSSGLLPATLDLSQPPILFSPPDATKLENVTIRTQNNTWVDLVFFASVFPMPPHPIHKHGVKMYQIGSGVGPFKWASVEEAVKEIPHQFNLENPPRRDTFASLPAGDAVNWVVVRYHVSSPGAWLLHCHISNHMMGGMSMVILDGVDAWPKVPAEYLNYS